MPAFLFLEGKTISQVVAVLKDFWKVFSPAYLSLFGKDNHPLTTQLYGDIIYIMNHYKEALLSNPNVHCNTVDG